MCQMRINPDADYANIVMPRTTNIKIRGGGGSIVRYRRGLHPEAAQGALRPSGSAWFPWVPLFGSLIDIARSLNNQNRRHHVRPREIQKQLSLTDLTFIRAGRHIRSGWLFAASHVSSIAGPAGILSWLLGGFAVLLLGIVCASWAPRCRGGGVVRYPVFSPGPLLGYLMGFITLIAFSSLIAIEVVAARQYAAAWFPA